MGNYGVVIRVADVLALAAMRGVTVTDLQVSEDGAFDGGGSTGISYTVDIAGDADDAQLQALVGDAEQDATIPATLRQGTSVSAERIAVAGA